MLRAAFSFPTGKHDDKVDVWALLGMALDKTHPAIFSAATAKSKPNRPTDYQGYSAEPEGWKVA